MTQRPLTISDWRQATAADRAAHAARLDDADPAIFIARGPAGGDGIPLAVKDNIDAAGFATTAACPAYAYKPEASATAVARLEAAGFRVAGKTNLDQFATGLVGVRSPYGVPANPFDPACIPGGSSSGSAVAVARGLVPVALGTDTAGSGRVPAMMNNIVGLKPSRGLVPATGVVPACRSLDCVSIFALTVPDALAALAIAGGPDTVDPFSRALRQRLPRPGGWRVAVPHAAALPWFGDGFGPEWWAAALDLLRRTGATVEEIDPAPFLAAAALLYDGPWVAERTAAVGDFIDAHWDACDPVVRAIVRSGRARSATDTFAGLYRLAAIAAETAPTWDRYDALMVPTAPRHWTLAEVAAEPVARNSALGTWTNFVNLLDLAALAVPTGFHRNGLPIGATLIGPTGSDLALAAIGGVVHALAGLPLGATGAAADPASLRPARASGPGVEVAVFGAHLTGEPRSAALIALGAAPVRTIRTASRYRMVLLEGAMPRPGLVLTERDGVAIEGEVWLVPEPALPGLLAEVRAPLALGLVALDDGSEVRGFVCAAGGEAGAPDISRFGGWRAWRQAAAKTQSPTV
ncbi:allophanate hydrolase [Stella humosa]|uniref:Allophanate hydrolase n=1 Tax=Stella humosa TaxID=94 RepID=A0A3N1KYH0_9PROT|nr:allophanate hydrolase [Stella humosa]ROP83378.1 allophanate hydrolase [Stella humosa]BBK29838.1 allophanate hydrolase [Stella humosa]